MSNSLVHEVLNVGIIAFGFSGRVFHGPFIITNPKFKLVAVFERSKSESNEFSAKHGLSVEIVRTEIELVQRNDVDLVIVCSPIEFHFEHAMLALRAGKHVIVEKAFCSTSSQAKELLEFASKVQRICIPYQNRRYDSDFLTIKQMLSKLGKLAEYNGFFNRYSPKVRSGNWKDEVVGSGGNFLSLGSHMIDQAVVLFGMPQRVWADVRAQREGGMLDDAWEVHLFYDSGSVDENGLKHGGFRAILKGSLLCRDHALRYAIHGMTSSWVKEGMDTQEAHLMTGELPEYFTRESEAGRVGGTEGYGREPENQWGLLTSPASEGCHSDVTSRTPPVRGSYHYFYDSVYDSIVQGAPPAVSAADAVAVLRLIEIARQSSAEGRVLPFSE